jgi:hypothetical protein
MKRELESNNCVLFAEYAGNNPSIWRAIEGQEVMHTSFGRGVVIKTGPGQRSDSLYIWIRFEKDPTGQSERQFTPASFENGKFFSHLDLPNGLDGIEVHRERPRQQLQTKKRPKEPSKHEQKKHSVHQICVARAITTLVHFTCVRNLSSIMEKGLLGRSILETWPPEQQPKYNDTQRLEGYKGAVCLSISFPNYRMFYKYSRDNRAEWAILLLAPSVLWELDCAFYEDNAASRKVRYTPLAHRKQASALMQMFTDYDQVCRQNLQIPDCYPTNPQAEVLVFDPIPPFYVNAVHFWSEDALQQWIEDNPYLDSQMLCVSQQYFQPREDWVMWETTQQDTIADLTNSDMLF